jgi:hypothetical protein
MKRVALPLSKLSVAQKLDLMEALWADLTRDKNKFKSPAWHETVLRDREEAFATGKVSLSDWEQAKKRIKKQVS